MADFNDIFSKLGISTKVKPEAMTSSYDNMSDDEKEYLRLKEEDPSALTPAVDPTENAINQEIAARTKAPVIAEQPIPEESDFATPNRDLNLEEEIQSAATDSGVDLSGKPDAPKGPSYYEDILNSYRSLPGAQKDYQDRIGNLDMLAGANKIAQAFAMGSGGKIDDGSELVSGLKKSAGIPVDQIKQKLDMAGESMKMGSMAEMVDPKSDVSKYTREQAYALLKKLNPDVDYSGKLDNMSAEQLQKLPGMKNLGSSRPTQNRYVTVQDPDGKVRSKLINMDTGDTIKELGLAGYALGSQIDPVTNMPYQISKSDPTMQIMSRRTPGMGATSKSQEGSSSDVGMKESPAEKKQTYGSYRASGVISPREVTDFVNKDKEGFEQQNAPKMTIMSGLDSVKALANEAIKNPNAAASLGGIIGSLFEPGKLTDEDAKRYVARLGLANKASDWMNEAAKGTIKPERAKQIVQTAKAYRDELDKIVRKNAAAYATRTKSGLIRGEEVDPEILADFYYTSKYQGATDATGEVKRKTADGKVAIFDAKTKKFLRYEK